jgi:uncharacterized protein (TIGR02145 family)
MAKYFLRHLVVDILATYYKLKNHNMMLKILPLLMLPCLGMAQINSKVKMPMGENTTSEKQPLEIKRNATYNLEEIKVRWKKAALENCTGVPCIVTPTVLSFTCGTSTVTDIDGNSYNTVLIGTQCWTKQNLKVSKYNDGTLIPDLTTSTSNPWAPTSGARTGYDVSVVTFDVYVGTFGYLYNWYAATDSRKLCPAGWHVPTDTEWTTLTTYLGGSGAGRKLKSKETNTTSGVGLGWNPASPASPGDDDFDFSALPGGYRRINGSFNRVRTYAYFWSATEINATNASDRNLKHDFGNVFNDNSAKSVGASVRCLRD